MKKISLVALFLMGALLLGSCQVKKERNPSDEGCCCFTGNTHSKNSKN